MITKNVIEMPDTGTDNPKLPVDFINTDEVCRRLGISRRTSTNLREAGKLPAIKLGKLVRYHWPTVAAKLLREQIGPQQ